MLGRYFALFDQVVAEDRKLARQKAVWGTVLGLVSVAAFYGCYAWVADTASLGTPTLGDVTLYPHGLPPGQAAFASVLTALGSIYEDALAANLFAYLDTDERRRPRISPLRIEAKTPSLELRHVTFISGHRPVVPTTSRST